MRYEFKELGIGEILDHAIRVVKEQAGFLLKVAGFVMAAPVFVMTWISTVSFERYAVLMENVESGEMAVNSVIGV